jgi:UDP-glucose:(heptosyl)LPS alpha-1,3-glucosyltransferase
MKITMPIDVWDPQRGGAERYLDRLSRELIARGHEVTVLCSEQRVSTAPGQGGPDVQVLRVPRFPRWLRELSFAKEAVRVHRSSGHDILFAVRHALEADVYQPHGGSLRAAREAAGRALPPWRQRARAVAGGLRPSLRVLLWLDREVFSRSPRLVTVSVSRKVEDDLRRVYPEVQFRFERIYNPIDAELFHDRDRSERAAGLRSRFGIPAHRRIAVFVAHRFRPKGLHHALRAVAALPEWHLVVAGRDRPGPFLRAAARLRTLERTHIAGPVSDPRGLYAGADALVLPTYYDPCSLAVLEAMACGTPVVTTRENGASELIEDGVSGFSVERPQDARAISAALGAIGGRWENFHDAARRSASRWGWIEHVDRMQKVLSRARPRE